MDEPDRQRLRQRLKLLERMLSELRHNWLFVEGQKDRNALRKLGCTKVLTISGNMRQSCDMLGADVGRVIVLTDLDRRGDELMLAAKDELESRSVLADTATRKRLAGILRLRNFEDAERKYRKFMEKAEEIKKGR